MLDPLITQAGWLRPMRPSVFAATSVRASAAAAVQIVSGQSSPTSTTLALGAVLSEYMEGVRNSTNEIEGVNLPKPQFEFKEKPQGDLEVAVLEALQMSLDIE